MKRYQTLVIAIPDPTPEEQVEGQALHDRQALKHSLFQHPWLVHMTEGDWRGSALIGADLLGNSPPGLANKTGAGLPAACQSAPSEQADAIDHPAHYTSHPSGIEPIQITRYESFTRGNAIKYLMRAGRKDPDPRIDLRKARRYIDFELEDLDRQADTEASGAPVA